MSETTKTRVETSASQIPSVLRRLCPLKSLAGSELNLANQFAIAATGVVVALMLLLGYVANHRLERAILTSAGEFGALYVQNFLTPHVQYMYDNETLPEEAIQDLDLLLGSPRLQGQILDVVIWNRHGVAIYSQNKAMIGQTGSRDDIAAAMRGEIVTNLEEHLHDDTGDAVPIDTALIEIYAPLSDNQTGEVIAVGEVYERATGLQSDIRQLEISTWSSVALIAVPMITLLYLIVKRGSDTIDQQKKRLKLELQKANSLAEQNARLRQSADKARVEATRTTETLLGRIGSDLHDGPVQLLSLLILKLGAHSTAEFGEEERSRHSRDAVALAQEIMMQLRVVSTGLSLPELEHLSLDETLQLAVKRHSDLTGTDVETSFEPLPPVSSHPLKICIYRIVQEALMNSTKHANGQGQTVTAKLAADNLVSVTVSDTGPGMPLADAPARSADRLLGHRLGLKGMRSRVRAFGGHIDISSTAGTGTRIAVQMPID